jgi:release factor glutamine methyltransferase
VATWAELEATVLERLGDRREARWLMERASGASGAAWQSIRADSAPDRVRPFVDGMVERRLAGEPLQYVLGEWSFRRLELMVDPRVLIPRPETEQVVEEAIRELRDLPTTKPTVVDLGTGSGAIALSIAVEVTGAHVWATDTSEDAIAVAQSNVAGAGGMAATRIRVVGGSWFGALPSELAGEIDMIVSNPPYIAEHEVADLDRAVVDWEPLSALVPGPTGLEAIEHIVAEAPRWLRRPGSLVVELDPSQAEAAIVLALEAGFASAEVRPDLAGRPRTLVARL